MKQIQEDVIFLPSRLCLDEESSELSSITISNDSVLPFTSDPDANSVSPKHKDIS